MVKSWSDDVAEDSARQRFAKYMRLQRRNARGDFKKRMLPCTLALENFVTPLQFLILPVLFYFPLPFGLNLATLQLCA